MNPPKRNRSKKMLELKNIVKEYETADEKVVALKGVSMEFRKSEFVSVLGPSGCGKTTLLNIIGGLDRYTSGDLIINGKSTANFNDKDWDTYRNHSVGFVFQSYNLIPHQTVVENVELALTLAGIGAKERRERAIAVLDKVGLKNKINARPNQLSGGQMQRVAIARALINDPEILLADEPTGALDSKTSVQIMELLKELSLERLIIMVTHNPELAEKYSTRIIRLLDGELVGDDKPLSDEEIISEREAEKVKPTVNKGRKKTSMSFLTALSLSFRNLMTKKGRTILVSFAGSIGIIGIALILSLSSGFQTYINRVQADTLSNYPITVQDTYSDFTSVLGSGDASGKTEYPDSTEITANDSLKKMLETLADSQVKNNLYDFKKWLDEKDYDKNKINAIKYTYDLNFEVYGENYKGEQNSRLQSAIDLIMQLMQGSAQTNPMFSTGMRKAWSEAIDNEKLLKSQYELVGDGRWMDFTADNEVMVVLDKYNRIPDYNLAALGLIDENEILYPLLKTYYGESRIPPYVTKVEDKDKSDGKFQVSDILGKEFSVCSPSAFYTKWDSDGNYHKSAKDVHSEDYYAAIANGKKVKVVGVIRPKEGSATGALDGTIIYNKHLTKALLDAVGGSEVVKAQKAAPETDVTSGKPFGEATDATGKKVSYDGNMIKFGYADESKPQSISIYPSTFENKKYVSDLIAEYNADKSKEDKISYTDYLDIMMSSITDIINAVSYVLIGFVSVSLIVSSIMIGIITYISVLERTKEIGVLRALGASKKDVARVFNAETLIIGLAAGVIGIGLTVLLDIPLSMIIYALADIKNVAVLPWQGGLILVAISMVLTLIAGLIPSRLASKKDPVIALRTE